VCWPHGCFWPGLGLPMAFRWIHPCWTAAPYDRIISLYGAHTENLLALGAPRRLIGIDRQSAHLPGAEAKEIFSYHDDPERFLAARPDLVLIRPMIARGYPRLVQRMRQSGIRVVSVQPTTVDQLEGYWRLLGQLAGREAQADRMNRVFERSVADLSVVRPGG
jgi:iron complex transport system substrate-binding protein